MSSPASQVAQPADATTQYNAELAAVRASGVASNAFQVRNNHGVLPLSLPAEGDFNTFEELQQHAQDYCKLAGWAITQGKGSEKRQGRHIKFLICKHFGEIDKRFVKDEDRKKTGRVTKRTGCSVKLKVRELASGVWALRHMEGKTEHNHEFNDASLYHEHRQLTPAQQALVHANRISGIPASRTKSALEKTDPNLMLISRDIYNKTAQMERELLQGKEPNQSLIDDLNALKAEGKMVFEYEINPVTRKIEKLFLADAR